MMKNIVRFVLLGMFACFASCTEKSVREIKLLEKYDSLSISIDYPLLSNYGKLTSCVMGKEVYAVGYNHHLHSLDFINVSGGKHKVIELQREGADAVLAPQSYCVTDEHIVWNDASGIVMLTTLPRVLLVLNRVSIFSTPISSVKTEPSPKPIIAPDTGHGVIPTRPRAPLPIMNSAVTSPCTMWTSVM